MDQKGKSYINIKGESFDDGLSTITNCIKHFAVVKGKHEAFVFADHVGGRESVTFAELYQKSFAVAKSLVKLGVTKGEIIAINVHDCPEWLYLQFGVMFAGAIPVNISFTHKDGSDIIALMKKLKKCCLIALDPGTDGNNWEIIMKLLDSYSPDGKALSRKLPSLRYVIGYEVGESSSRKMTGVKTIGELMNEANTEVTCPDINENDEAFLVQTSGSTGVPKLIVHTHRSFLSLRQLGAYGFVNASFVHYNDIPFSYMGGYPMSFLAGQKRVTVSGFRPIPEDKDTSIIDIIQKEKCTFLTALPPKLHRLKHSKNIPADWPVSVVLTGGQPLNQSIAGAIGKVAPSIIATYGTTELFFVSAGAIDNVKDFREFFCGNICNMPGLEVKVVDKSGEIVPFNTRGEVYVRSPGMFKEYYNDPEKTAAVLTEDRWYKTDDIGMLTEDAELFIYGRLSDIIISGGMNITPDTLEQVIKLCPGVYTVVVVPVPDEVYHQVLCACVIRKTGSDLTEEQLRRYCDEFYNDNPKKSTAIPKFYMFFDVFPETSFGKTKRAELKKIASETFSSSKP